MAKTDGHGNPNWTRDETILALDLFLKSGGVVPSASDQRVIELSKLLRSLPYHADAAKKASFRNPDGVSFKLQNLRQVATGKGLGNVSKMDREVWSTFGDDANSISKIAAAIRTGLNNELPADGEEEIEFSEGRLLTQIHYRRERSRKLQKAFFDEKSKSTLTCEVCGLNRPDLADELQKALFEAHHVIPVADAGERKTKLSDLALLCACCHRLIHKLIFVKKRWFSIDDARRAILRK